MIGKDLVLRLDPHEREEPKMVNMHRSIKAEEALAMIANQQAKISRLLGFLKYADTLVDKAQARAEKATNIAARACARSKKEIEQSRDWYQKLLETKTFELTRENELLKELLKFALEADNLTVAKPYAPWASKYDIKITETKDGVTVSKVMKPCSP